MAPSLARPKYRGLGARRFPGPGAPRSSGALGNVRDLVSSTAFGATASHTASGRSASAAGSSAAACAIALGHSAAITTGTVAAARWAPPAPAPITAARGPAGFFAGGIFAQSVSLSPRLFVVLLLGLRFALMMRVSGWPVTATVDATVLFARKRALCVAGARIRALADRLGLCPALAPAPTPASPAPSAPGALGHDDLHRFAVLTGDDLRLHHRQRIWDAFVLGEDIQSGDILHHGEERRLFHLRKHHEAPTLLALTAAEADVGVRAVFEPHGDVLGHL